MITGFYTPIPGSENDENVRYREDKWTIQEKTYDGLGPNFNPGNSFYFIPNPTYTTKVMVGHKCKEITQWGTGMLLYIEYYYTDPLREGDCGNCNEHIPDHIRQMAELLNL